MAVTIKDIAKKAGVSYSTVSRALNDLDTVNADTKKLVLKTAEELGYVPNTSAVNLKTRRSNMLGVYFSTINNMSSPVVLHSVLTGVYDVVRNKYNVVVKGIDFHVPGSLNPSFLDGIILISQRDEDKAFMEEARKKHIPQVIVNRTPPFPMDAVLTNEREAVRTAMDYLLEKGHRKIAVLEGPSHLYSTKQRHQGWVESVQNHGLSEKDFQVWEGTYRFESGYGLAAEILAKEPTALLSFNDDMALGVERYMKEQGKTIPKDLSIVGFDNWNRAIYTSMDLTTVDRNMYNLAQEACRLLLDRVESSDPFEAPTKTLYLNAPLIERSSVLDLN